MALTVCPECKKQISDKCKSCIHCGYPLDLLTNNTPQPMESGVSYNETPNSSTNVINHNSAADPVPQQNETTDYIANNSVMNNSLPGTYAQQSEPFTQQSSVVNSPIATTKRNIAPILIILLIILLAGITICAIFFLFPKPMVVEKVEIGEWTKNYEQEYGLKVTSEQKQPFVALIEMTEDKDTYEEYVYMENGEGEITRLRSKTSDNDELPKESARAIGFYEGKAVSNDFIKKIHTDYITENFMNEMGWTSLKKSGISDLYKMAKFTVEIQSGQTGLLIYDVSTNLNQSIDKNRIVPIVEGKGLAEITYYLEVSDKDKSFDAKFIPRFFISAESISSDQYDIITNLSLDSEETIENDEGIKTKRWNGTEKLSLKNNTSGLLIYRVKRITGEPVVRSWLFDDDYQEWYGVEQAKNKVVNISFSQIFSLLAAKPEFQIDIMGYLNYKDFEGNKEVLKGDGNDSGGFFGNYENEAQKQMAQEESKAREASEQRKREEEEKNYFYNIKSKIGADSSYCTIGSDGSYMEIDTNPYDLDDYSSYSALEYIEEANDEMGFGDSLYRSMLRTRSLDGTQTEENDKIKVRWTYHPDHGLEVVYSKK